MLSERSQTENATSHDSNRCSTQSRQSHGHRKQARGCHEPEEGSEGKALDEESVSSLVTKEFGVIQW